MKKNNVDFSRLKTAILGAEVWSDQLKEVIKTKYNINTFDIYGLTEISGPGVACECHEHDGLHVFDDYFYPEIIREKTSDFSGQQGELVITTLQKEAMPLLRYRTHDITKLYTKKCACGNNSVRIGRITGRTDDLMIIKGINIFPKQIEEILMRNPLFSPYYYVEIDRVNNFDTVKIFIEFKEECSNISYEEKQNLCGNIKTQLRNELLLLAEIEVVDTYAITRSSGKTKRIFDKRKI